MSKPEALWQPTTPEEHKREDAVTEAVMNATGSEHWYRHWTKLLAYTDGVKAVAEAGGAYWLIDAIASYQPKLRKTPSLADFQLWEFQRFAAGGGLLTCRKDRDVPPVVEQRLEYTDFPYGILKLYVEGDVLLLPDEH